MMPPDPAPRAAGQPLTRAAGLLVVALIAAAHAALVLLGDPLRHPSVDSYCHASFARDIARGQLLPDLGRALPWTLLRDMNVDHYWGHHVLTAPFMAAFDQLLGMKLAAGFFFVSIPAALYLLMRSRGVAWAELWALLPLHASTQDWRYLQLRGGPLILVLLAALLHVAFFDEGPRRRRLLLLGLLGYVAMLSYHGGTVLLVFHAAGALWMTALAPQTYRPRLADTLATLAGSAAGLALNPYMDRRASTFRFAWYHITRMGTDADNLYTDWARSEFRGFPVEVLLGSPSWLLLLALTLGAAGWAIGRRLQGRSMPPDTLLLAGLSLLGVALTARAARLREYAVPIAVLLLALAARPLLARLPPRAALLGPLVAAAFSLLRASTTLDALANERVHAGVFAGARPLLAANGDAPILNLAESDYCMLRWENPGVVCVQALSRYFLWPDRQLYAEVRELHERADASPRTASLLRRFHDRGVRLVVTHSTHRLHAWAQAHPEALALLFEAPLGAGAIWQIR